MTWNLLVTRVIGLLETWIATEVYSNLPVQDGGFNLNSILINENGTIQRYIDQDEMNQLEKIIKKGNYIKLLKEFEAYDKSVLDFFKKDPFKNREEFIKIFRRLWIQDITAYFIGNYSDDQKSIDICSDLRGSKSAQHIAVSEFLPKLFKQISKVLGIDFELLKYALPDEIVSLNLHENILVSRRKEYVIKSIKKIVSLLVDDEAKKFIQDFLKNNKSSIDENISELKGNSAFKGKVSGRVVIVNNESELINVKDGDVLVSPMTRTSFLSAMKKAAAFVTDEGGVTCHAAIIARELKKVCVVGTKVASKVLKNGMHVEVDADKGIVKIIK